MAAASGADLDAFENGDFENAAGHGKLDKFTEAARGYGFNGGGGARLTGFVRHSFEFPVKKTLKLKKGERYVFSVETRNNSKEVLEQIALETNNPETGKYEGYWGRKIIDIGGGTTEIAMISAGGVVECESIKTAGGSFDEAIVKYVRKKYNMLIGLTAAEELKK